jgi:hypothetical protein
MLLCSVRSSSAQHRAVGNLWRERGSFLLHQEIHRSLSVVLNDLHHHAEQKNKQNLKPSPLLGVLNVGEEILRPGGGMHPP